MALSTSELQRIKAELGWNVLNTGAEPFIGVAMVFEQVIAVYMTAGAETTSATSVPDTTEPKQRTITLTSATGFAAGNRIWVDVDDRLESTTIQSLSGANATVVLSKPHSGTYPVYVDGGEAIVRELLARIKATKDELANIFGEGALKQVDEIAFYQTGMTLFGSTAKALMFWRDELASAIGDVSLNRWRRRGGGGSMSVY
ncbi:MAG TPA: hypothetical protein VL494_13670 [Steroidobacteraceae bacterium]|jgi:hypothetical protein|nr:hypothetical protein [Steroidobacteraceae bacterium]